MTNKNKLKAGDQKINVGDLLMIVDGLVYPMPTEKTILEICGWRSVKQLIDALANPINISIIKGRTDKYHNDSYLEHLN